MSDYEYVRELRAEVAELREQLAAATGLVSRWLAQHEYSNQDPATWAGLLASSRAFLAAQPAAPYGTPDESPGFNAAWPLGKPKPAAPARTEACSACTRNRCECYERECDKCHWPGSPNCRHAQLARRGLKP